MSVNNTLAKSASNKIVEYECNGETVKSALTLSAITLSTARGPPPTKKS